ncbi:GNAT family N-acetyltransferase [Salinivibrio sp. ES.052]|uniref:GNAT family N-acetyltransferase n=1 Tax=Salinivibrio sp. ES.052 TaxID=1882823 RepID=UPI000928F8D1|nr:GNAT family N-acetyltransferase [Salinivibrio sp. ES.052]SIO38099.1 Acetyltransferase (GNAT) domain-containing protein [Salinivibrio sp. ES.052]
MEIKEYSREFSVALSELYLSTRISTFSWLDRSDYRLSDFERDTDGERVLVAFFGEQIVGFIAIWEPDNFIHHLYVSSEYQNKNIGTQLLAVAKSLCGRLSLKCMVKNEKAVGFYESHGFLRINRGTDSLGDYYLMALAQT